MQSRRKRVSDTEDRAALLAVLQAQPKHRFRASTLKTLAGVPKNRPRRLLEGIDGVHLTHGKHWWFWWDKA
jgi:hypothetical protein